MTQPLRKTRALVAGIVASLAGAGIGHLVAGLSTAQNSPVLVVGSAVIDRTPTPLKDWAIEQFGSWDKVVLLISVGAATGVLAGVSGLLARRRLRYGIAAQSVLVLLALGAAWERPGASLLSLVPGLVTGVVGVVVLITLVRLDRGAPLVPGSAYPSGGDTRRAFLAGAAGVTAAGAGTALLGQRLASTPDTTDLPLPRAGRPLPALPQGLEKTHRGISPLRTPSGAFYRVDTSLSVPRVDRDEWRLRIDGDVDRPMTLTFDDLIAMDLVERDITMTCVSNTVGGGYVGAARWLGVRTRDVLDRVGIRDPERKGAQLLSRSVEGFTISTPLGALLDDRDALLAIGMNGSSLPAVHGFPVRMVTPGLYGFVGSTKWLESMTVTTYAKRRAYWTQRDWATDAPIKPSARIDTPRSFADVSGRTVVGGVAWAQRHGVTKVQLRIDGTKWRDCTLGPDVNVDYWRQWSYVWDDPEPGQHTLEARVVFGADNRVQSATRSGLFPDGSSGIQERIVMAS